MHTFLFYAQSLGFSKPGLWYIPKFFKESQANKYTFVWKKIANRNCEHLMKKIHVLLRQIDYVMRNGQTKPGYNLQSWSTAPKDA